jgi:hypothetical protein
MIRKINAFGAKCKSRLGAIAWVAIGLAFVALQGQCAEIYTFEDSWGQAGFNLAQQDAAGVEIVFSVRSMEIFDQVVNGEDMKGIQIPGVILPNDAGAPNLPGMGRYIAIPEGARAELEIVEYRTETFHDLNIAPAPVIPLDTDPVLRYFKNTDIYGVDALYPAQPAMISAPDQMRGVDVVIVGITPFQYNPVTRDLTVYKDLRVRVNFIGGTGRFGEDRLRSRWWDPILEQNLINYTTLPEVNYNRRRPNMTDEDNVEYVIIVPDDPVFIAWADTLKKWRNEQGILTGITTLTEIGGNDATLIENYINDAYRNWQIPPVAVLLLSDYQASGSEVYGITSPLWTGYCVSDNIYGDVDGNDLPDVAMARITAQGNQQLQTMIGKMLNWERNPSTNPNVYSRPLIAGGWQSDRWFILCCEVIYGYFQNELGKTPTRQYAGASGPPASWSSNPNTYMIVNYFGPTGLGYIGATPSYLTDWSGSATGINNAINAGTFLVQHRDHGELTGWSSPSYHITDFGGLINTVHPFVFSMNCLTGQYNSASQCFTEAFHRLPNYGALGLLAASQVSYSFVNDAYTWGVYDCMWPDFDPGYGNPNASWNLRPCFGNASGKYYLAASSWPYNPGDKDVTYHLFHHHGDAFITLYSEVPQNMMVLHDNVLLSGVTSFTVTANAGALIGLSVNSQIIGTGEGTGAPVAIAIPPQLPGNNMRVTVTLANYYRYIADVQIIPPSGPYVIFDSLEVDDDLLGNNNAQLDFGETSHLTIRAQNVGIQTANNVTLNISSADPMITIQDSTQFVGNIPAGNTATADHGFQVQLAVNAPDLHPCIFTLRAVSGSEFWESPFAVICHAPECIYTSNTISDPPPGGNQNGNLDPGESATINVTVTNDGSSTVSNLLVTLSASDPYVTVSGGGVNVGTLTAGASAIASFAISASASCPQEHDATLQLSFNGGGYTGADEFVITVGDILYAPTGPDAFGYSAYDPYDAPELPVYQWVEISSDSGGPGIMVPFTLDDQTFQYALPFTFRYYGVDYDSFTIATNGWIATGIVTQEDYNNSGIPDPDGPERMIAAYWEDLSPQRTNSGKVWQWFDATNHRLIVEYNHIEQFAPTNSFETFQVILYDPDYYQTISGNGRIKFQYKDMSTSAQSEGTMGIENESETIGLQYCFDGSYDIHAHPVVDGFAVMYSTPTSGPALSVTLVPYGTPIIIPSTGGSFSYNIAIANSGSSPATVDVWCDITLPNGHQTSPTLGPVNLTLPAGFSLNRDRTQNIPRSAPPGNYTYNGYVGLYPGTVYDQDSFPFSKSSTGDGPAIDNWDNSGESFADWMTPIATAVPESYTLGQNHPNPFNPITTINFSLPEDGWVKLAVYDLLGREVAVLMNSYRPAGTHETTFDASALASGIYVYRLTAGSFSAVKKLMLLK